MTNDTKPYTKLHPLSLFLTFGVGNIPFAPGTWGSLMALPIACIAFLFFQQDTAYVIISILILLFLALGTMAADRYMAANKVHDAKEIVIDEVIGQLITLLMAAPFIGPEFHNTIQGIIMILSCFVLFRFFDILKPWPVSWADQKLHNGFGVMLDDVFAGIYAGIVFIIGFKLYEGFMV